MTAGALSAVEAVRKIRPGQRVFVGSACATPRALLRALEELPVPIPGVTLVHALTDRVGLGEPPRTAYLHRVFYAGRDIRDLASSGLVDYVPISLADVPRMFTDGHLPLDVALVQVAPPDGDGTCSLGVSVDITRAAVLAADVVIAEVNPAMPRTRGNSRIPFDRITHVVDVSTPVIEYVHDPATGVAEQIARYVARLVDDHATLQVGLGRVPNEMLRHLHHRRDLSVHSDVITDPVADLVDAGVITGPVVGSWAMGTDRLYRRLATDDRFSLHPIEHVCDPAVIAGHERMVSVTQAFTVDLSGQVCTERLDGELYGGVSTGPDFHRGALAAARGVPIICLSSRTPAGEPAVRPALGPDEPVGIGRADVRWVVTEYGTAYLFGRSLAERAVAMIGIAHPDDRATLLEQARERGVVARDQELRSGRAYPVDEERELALRDGRRVTVRPTRAGDRGSLQELFHRLPEKDVTTRFFNRLTSLTDQAADHLCNVDYDEEMAFAAVVGPPEHERIVATSSYYRDPRDHFAEVAYMVEPDWQGSGLATALHARTTEYARAHGVRGFTADVLMSNPAMLKVFRRAAGHTLRMDADAGVYEVRMRFTDEGEPG
ncbi:MAG TPA: GNAT family N-acetyltransferase [Nocardioides sp.]|nr:GNAT family N-acetyltransferase [Nocardioides sp.]